MFIKDKYAIVDNKGTIPYHIIQGYLFHLEASYLNNVNFNCSVLLFNYKYFIISYQQHTNFLYVYTPQNLLKNQKRH